MEINRAYSYASFAGKILFILINSLILLSCTSINLKLISSKELNTNTSLESLPVRVKIYQLSDATAFNEATFRQLWKSDESALGKTLLDKKELTINPNENQVIKLNKQPQAEYIAIIGIFRRHDDNGWKSLRQIPGTVNSVIKQLTVQLNGHSVEFNK